LLTNEDLYTRKTAINDGRRSVDLGDNNVERKPDWPVNLYAETVCGNGCGNDLSMVAGNGVDRLHFYAGFSAP